MAVTNDLATDRRVLRHAETLTERGLNVTLVGRLLPESGPVDTACRVVRMTLKHRRGWRFYAEYNRRLVRQLRQLNPDVVWANDTDTLPGCYVASRLLRVPLVMDAHELFPEVPEIQGKPFVKWVWRTLEGLLMPRCDALLTVCDSIAEHYRLRYGVSMTVVRNLPLSPACVGNPGNLGNGFDKISKDFDGSSKSWKSKKNPEDLKDFHDFAELGNEEKVLLYQGKVNKGRGVDWAIDALEWLDGCQLVVAGDGDLLAEMKAYAKGKPWSNRVVFLGRVGLAELASLTPKADVGLVMLEDMGLSYHYALPNRIGDFVHAGVPMVVSDLPEMAAVVKRFRIGEVMREPGAKALADAVKRVLAKGKEAYDFAAARRDMDWEKEKQKLLECISVLKP